MTEVESRAGAAGNYLKTSFVGMLFALVVAAVASQLAKILFVATHGWEAKNWLAELVSQLSSPLLLPPVGHMVLALIMVAMSWVMWSQSKARGHTEKLTSFFSSQFFLLLLEVGLVVLYFALATTAEQDYEKYRTTGEIKDFVPRPSAVPEAIILLLIFVIFAAWDVVADVLASPRREWVPDKLAERVSAFVQGILTYCSVSIACALACLPVLAIASGTKGGVDVFLLDSALLSIVLWFRAGKKLEFHLRNIFPLEARRENTARETPLSSGDWVKVTLPVAIYFSLLMVVLWRLSCTPQL